MASERRVGLLAKLFLSWALPLTKVVVTFVTGTASICVESVKKRDILA